VWDSHMGQPVDAAYSEAGVGYVVMCCLIIIGP
jgi:hypothetical protein